MSLACRACRVPVGAEGGCAVCVPIKKNLVAVDEGRGEVAPLSEVGSEVVDALRAQLTVIRRVLKDGNTKQRAAAGKELIAVANSMAKVLEAARKLQNDGIQAVKNMAFLERAELFIGWYLDLPPPYRAEMRRRQAEAEADYAKPKELVDVTE